MAAGKDTWDMRCVMDDDGGANAFVIVGAGVT